MKINRKTIAVSTVSLIAAGGLSAFAYVNLTAPAQGDGSAAAGQNISATVDVPKDLVIGASPSTVTVSVSNPNAFPVTVTRVVLNSPTTPDTKNCPGDSFVLTDTDIKPAPPVTVAAGATKVSVATTKIQFVDDGQSQSGCLGQRVHVDGAVS